MHGRHYCAGIKKEQKQNNINNILLALKKDAWSMKNIYETGIMCRIM